MKTIHIDCKLIKDKESLHDIFAAACEFPEDYGRNWDAWIDSLSDLKPHGKLTVIQLDHAEDLAGRKPKLFRKIVDGIAFINWRQIEDGRAPLLALA